MQSPTPAGRPAPLPFPGALLGFRVSGDMAGLTYFQTRRRKLVAYPATSPKEPPTPAQQIQRARFRQAVAAWVAAPITTKRAYESVSLAASLCATGHDLWVHLSFTQNASEILDLEHRTGIPLPMPPAV